MTMRKWLLAGGIALSGLAFAAQQDDMQSSSSDVNDVDQQVQSQSHEKVQKAKKKAGEASEKAAGAVESGGNVVGQSFREAGRSIEGQHSALPMGMTRRGDVKNTLTTDALGLLSGSGLNATWTRSLSPKWSFVGGANYARTATPLGAATAFGLRAGADYFIIGEHNEGLRIGPRLDVGFGASTVGATGGFAGIGAAGEIGYNWISSRGLTAGAGLGLRGAFGGGSRSLILGNRVGQGSVGPYLDLTVGYSWEPVRRDFGPGRLGAARAE